MSSARRTNWLDTSRLCLQKIDPLPYSPRHFVSMGKRLLNRHLTSCTDRCLQTSAPVAAALGAPVYVDNGLSEWYRPVVPGTGLHPIPPPAETAASAFPSLHIDAAWRPTWVPSRKGESVEELHNRCQGFLRTFIPRTEQLHGGRHKAILLVSHAATAIALTREFVGDRNLSMRVACCSLTTLIRPPEDCAQAVGVWQSRGLATGDFLRGGLERSWGFEDVELDDHQVRCYFFL
jgi:transcription factor C subunit 7